MITLQEIWLGSCLKTAFALLSKELYYNAFKGSDISISGALGYDEFNVDVCSWRNSDGARTLRSHPKDRSGGLNRMMVFRVRFTIESGCELHDSRTGE